MADIERINRSLIDISHERNNFQTTSSPVRYQPWSDPSVLADKLIEGNSRIADDMETTERLLSDLDLQDF